MSISDIDTSHFPDSTTFDDEPHNKYPTPKSPNRKTFATNDTQGKTKYIFIYKENLLKTEVTAQEFNDLHTKGITDALFSAFGYLLNFTHRSFDWVGPAADKVNPMNCARRLVNFRRGDGSNAQSRLVP